MIKEVKKVWGKEEWLVNTNKYCAKILTLVKGYQCSLHYHKIKDETFYIREGIVELEVGQRGSFQNKNTVTFRLEKGSQTRIETCTLHRFRAITREAKILEVSTTHFDEDSYRIEGSGVVNKKIYKDEEEK